MDSQAAPSNTIEKEFVNRDGIVGDFEQAIAGTTPFKVMSMWGDSGIGKSWTIEYFVRLCIRKGIPFAHVDFRTGRDIDYLSVMSSITTGSFLSGFQPLVTKIDEFVNRYRTIIIQLQTTSKKRPVKIDLGTQNRFQGSFSEIAIGGDLIKMDLTIPKEEAEFFTRGMKKELFDSFVTCLGSIAPATQFALLVDSIDDDNADSIVNWIQFEVVPGIHRGTINNCIVVLNGQRKVIWDRTYKYLIKEEKITEFDIDTCRKYFEKVLNTSIPDQLLKLIYIHTQGHPLKLSTFVETLAALGMK